MHRPFLKSAEIISRQISMSLKSNKIIPLIASEGSSCRICIRAVHFITVVKWPPKFKRRLGKLNPPQELLPILAYQHNSQLPIIDSIGSYSLGYRAPECTKSVTECGASLARVNLSYFYLMSYAFGILLLDTHWTII